MTRDGSFTSPYLHYYMGGIRERVHIITIGEKGYLTKEEVLGPYEILSLSYWPVYYQGPKKNRWYRVKTFASDSCKKDFEHGLFEAMGSKLD